MDDITGTGQCSAALKLCVRIPAAPQIPLRMPDGGPLRHLQRLALSPGDRSPRREFRAHACITWRARDHEATGNAVRLCNHRRQHAKWTAHPGRRWRPDPSKPLRKPSQSLELGIALNNRSHEPAFRHDLEVQPPHLAGRAAHQPIAKPATAQPERHLGVVDGHGIAQQAVVGDGKAGRGVELKPVLIAVVAHAGSFSVSHCRLQERIDPTALLAMHLSAMLSEQGYRVVLGPFTSLSSATAALETAMPHAAALDVDLNGVMSFPVADALPGANVPFLWLSGIRAASFPDTIAPSPSCQKPLRFKHF